MKNDSIKYLAALALGLSIATWLVGENMTSTTDRLQIRPSLESSIESGKKFQGEHGRELYSPVGKRDPFKLPPSLLSGREPASVHPLEKYSLQQLQLRAILRGLGTPSALFEDPHGDTYIAKEGDRVGRERATLSRILNREVILTEHTVDYLGKEGLYERVMSLPRE